MNRKLLNHDGPLCSWSGPFLGCLVDGQPKQLEYRFVGWECATGLGGFSKLTIEGLNGVGGIDGATNFRSKLEEGSNPRPVVFPASTYARVAAIPLFTESVQRFGGLLLRACLIDGLQVLRHLLSVLPGD